MAAFFRKFFFDGFESGDYTYGTAHFIWIGVTALSVIGLVLWLRKKDRGYQRKVFLVISFVCFGIYWLRRLANVFSGRASVDYLWPFYMCNINTLLMPFVLLSRKKYLEDYGFVAALLGGLMTYAMPDGIFNDKYLTLGTLDSMTSHYVLVVVPLAALLTGYYRFRFKNIHRVYIGMAAVLLNYLLFAEMIYPGDYLFFKSGMPFTIPGVPQFVIIITLAVVLTAVFCVFCNLPYWLSRKKFPPEQTDPPAPEVIKAETCISPADK